MSVDQRFPQNRSTRTFALVWAILALVFFALNISVTRYSFPPVGFEKTMAVSGMSAIAAMCFSLAGVVVVVRAFLKEKNLQGSAATSGLISLVIFFVEFMDFFFE